MLTRRYITGWSQASPTFAEWMIQLIYMYDRDGDADMAHFLYGVNQ
jgi:hypothetical protein